MPQPIRILHLADSHVGAGMPSRAIHKRARRCDDILASYQRVVWRALEQHVDLVIHAGDVFDTSVPRGAALVAAAQPLLEIATAGIPVVIVPGNHERSALPGNVLLAHPGIHVAAGPTTYCFELRGRTVAVACWPCIRRNSTAHFADALTASGWTGHPADIRILALHQAFDGARCGPDGYRFRTDENVIPRDAVPRDFHYVAAGHIHRHQVLEGDGGGPPIVYAGSIDRISMAERDEPKGCVLVEFEGTPAPQIRFIEHEVRPMCLTSIDVTGLDAPAQIRSAVMDACKSFPAHAVASIQLTGRARRDALSALGLAELARDVRPDALIGISSRDVEHETHNRQRSQGQRLPTSLQGADWIHVDVQAAGTLPAAPGVYLLFDAAGRLLYVGKAVRLRARVASHVRAGRASSAGNGWTRHIAEVRVTCVPDDLAAELLEAHLIAEMRPPHNRRMRGWRDYVYLSDNGRAHGQLDVVASFRPGDGSLGPYRSRFQAAQILESLGMRYGVAQCPDTEAAPSLFAAAAGANLCHRYFDGRCAGPCAGKISAAAYAERLRAARALLEGVDESGVRDWENAVIAAEAAGRDDDSLRTLRRAAEVLRGAFNHGRELAAARQLIGGCLVWPAKSGGMLVVQLGAKGMRFHFLAEGDDATGHATPIRPMPQPTRVTLDRAVMDAYVLAARRLRQGDSQVQFITAGRNCSQPSRP